MLNLPALTKENLIQGSSTPNILRITRLPFNTIPERIVLHEPVFKPPSRE
jgi:hypothetical protein